MASTRLSIPLCLFSFFVLWISEPCAQAQNQAMTAIDGTYMGTYTCQQGSTNLILSLHIAGTATLHGTFTFYLPPSSHSHAYSYSLSGTFDAASGKFRLSPVKWEGPAPAGFTMVGLQGVLDPAPPRVSGKITNASCGAFQAAKEGEPSPGVSPAAAAKPAPNVSKSVAPETKVPSKQKPAASPAAPVQSASSANTAKGKATNGLVRKSQEYWNGYQTDLIRQVFDGLYGDDMDSDSHFRVMFGTYVEMFAKHCHADLPSHYEAVTITRSTETRDRYGNLVRDQVDQQWTVDVDPRFATKYKKYAAAPLVSGGEALRQTFSIMSGKSSFGSYTALGNDIDRFFEKEACASATMRQLNENLLRAAHGDPSLQDAGVTIPGASAESNPGASSQRFTSLRDGCVAYFHDPKNRPLGEFDLSSWCECIDAHYESVMTEEEILRYANDFGRLFWNGIAQPESNDPAWKRLHPIIFKCQR